MSEPTMVVASTPKLRPVGGTAIDKIAPAITKRVRLTAAIRQIFANRP